MTLLPAHQRSYADSIAGARAYLLWRRDANGFWCDFDLARGTSDEWVTAYVGSAFASARRMEDRELIPSILEVLHRRRAPAEGWGYSGTTPPDADSSAWVGRFAVEAGRPDLYTSGVQFILRCIRANGGIATYDSPVAIRRFLGSPPISLRGWCSGHVCVTANAAWLEGVSAFAPVRCFLRDAQLPHGDWPSYWWSGPEYGTWLAVDSLRRWSEAQDRPAIERALQWASHGDDLLTAFPLACRILVLAHDAPAMATHFAKQLLRLQLPDGSWPASAGLRIPPPDQVNPEETVDWVPEGKGFGSVNLDHARVFTTATALRALQSLENISRGLLATSG